MAAALGTFTGRLDDKGRVILPAKARYELSEATYLSRGQDHCLFLFSPDQFEEYKSVTREHVPEGMEPMIFDRMFFSSVVTQSTDKQGRITIPAQLREYAELEKDVTMIGLETRMEIWDTEAWNEYLARYEADFAAMSGGLR